MITTNEHVVGSQGGDVVMIIPPHPGEQMSSEKAIRLAAYLVIIADPLDGTERFNQVTKAIEADAG